MATKKKTKNKGKTIIPIGLTFEQFKKWWAKNPEKHDEIKNRIFNAYFFSNHRSIYGDYLAEMGTPILHNNG